MKREIEVIKEWFRKPGDGKYGEVLDYECTSLLYHLKEARRADAEEIRKEALKTNE